MSVRRAVRGVTTAVHTDAVILHSAAVVDFIGWVRTLVENGHMEDAAELWDSVAEVVHAPVPESPLREFASLPPMRRIPCCVEDCARCREHRGGFRFPWLGVWSRRSLVVQPGMSPADAWMALRERQELMDIMLVEVYASGFYLRDLMPVAWDGLVSRAVEAPGCARVSTVFRMFRQWQLGHELWRDPATSMATRAEARRSDRGRAQRAMAEWLEFVVDYPDLHIPATCALCGSLPPSMRGVPGLFLPYVHIGPCRPPLRPWHRVICGWKCQRFGLEKTRAASSSTWSARTCRWSKGGPEGRGLWGLLAAGVVMQSWQHSPPQCMDDQEGPGGHWPACEAVALVEAGRVAAWRDENGLQDDGDFAFRFSSWEQAVSGAGHVVAMAWLQARQSATDGMLQGVDRALQAAPSLPPRVPVPTSAKISMRRAPVRLKENVLSSPEAIVRRVDSLAAVWIRLGALRPGGELTPSLRADWEASCRRLAQAMVTASEPVTISNALMTVSELETWMQARQRNLPPGLIDLDNFVHQGTPAPTRSLNALRWLSKHGDLAWPLHRVTVPAVKVSKKKKGQAVVVGPPMLGYLEEQIEGLFKAGDQTWPALLGSWLVAVGVLRYKHISRSVPKKVSLSTFHAHCPRGKQRRLRGGFDFCIPATFTSGWNWTGPWLELWKKLPVEQKGRCGLCFDSHGVAWDLTEVHRQARICFRNQVETPELMTSYSWRRLMPTVGHPSSSSRLPCRRWEIGRRRRTKNLLQKWLSGTVVPAIRRVPGWNTLPWQHSPSFRVLKPGKWSALRMWRRPSSRPSVSWTRLFIATDIWCGPHPSLHPRWRCGLPWPLGWRRGQWHWGESPDTPGRCGLCRMWSMGDRCPVSSEMGGFFVVNIKLKNAPSPRRSAELCTDVGCSFAPAVCAGAGARAFAATTSVQSWWKLAVQQGGRQLSLPPSLRLALVNPALFGRGR